MREKLIENHDCRKVKFENGSAYLWQVDPCSISTTTSHFMWGLSATGLRVQPMSRLSTPVSLPTSIGSSKIPDQRRTASDKQGLWRLKRFFSRKKKSRIINVNMPRSTGGDRISCLINTQLFVGHSPTASEIFLSSLRSTLHIFSS